MIPLQFLIIGDRKIDFDFVDEFLMMGGKDYLRQSGAGQREATSALDAEALTDYFLRNRYAQPPNGNQPARWIDRIGALTSIGLESE